VGSVFRNADAFAVEKIYLCGISATPPHREINKTALGATESVEWEYVEDTRSAIKKLKESNFDVFAFEQTAGSIYLSDFEVQAKKIALVFGHEVKGVQQAVIDLCDGAIEIPQLGTKHSFNVSVSTGIAMWELYKKMML
jgi:tRNA G18 (ribose-2'-O)-methylase SpoU